MYSSEDLEKFYFQYQTEAMPKGISIEQCIPSKHWGWSCIFIGVGCLQKYWYG